MQKKMRNEKGKFQLDPGGVYFDFGRISESQAECERPRYDPKKVTLKKVRTNK